MFQKAVSTQDVTNPVSLSSFYCMYDIPLLLDVIRCNKNNIYSETSLILIQFMAQESVRYLQIQYNTPKCMIFTDTIQHNKVYDIYRYNTTQQSVRYLHIQYNTTNLYDKNLVFGVELSLQRFFWLQCPSRN
jgi:hypothetical protein